MQGGEVVVGNRASGSPDDHLLYCYVHAFLTQSASEVPELPRSALAP